MALVLRFAAASALAAGLALGACGGGEPALPAPDTVRLRATWDTLVAARDAHFRSADSPLPEAARAGFEGLAYFPYAAAFAVTARLEPALTRDTVRMMTSTGEPRPFVPVGRLAFTMGGRTHRLTAFRALAEGPLPAAPGLFVPFTDGTSGARTYGGGRYLDLPEPGPAEAATGGLAVDFNAAYHPYCAVNPAYSCPVPPAENRLPVPITAGERLPP